MKTSQYYGLIMTLFILMAVVGTTQTAVTLSEGVAFILFLIMIGCRIAEARKGD